MALERLDFFKASPSEKSDVYSLAMTAFTVRSSPTMEEGKPKPDTIGPLPLAGTNGSIALR